MNCGTSCVSNSPSWYICENACKQWLGWKVWFSTEEVIKHVSPKVFCFTFHKKKAEMLSTFLHDFSHLSFHLTLHLKKFYRFFHGFSYRKSQRKTSTHRRSHLQKGLQCAHHERLWDLKVKVPSEGPKNSPKFSGNPILLGGSGPRSVVNNHTVDGSEIPFPTTWDGAKTL